MKNEASVTADMTFMTVNVAKAPILIEGLNRNRLGKLYLNNTLVHDAKIAHSGSDVAIIGHKF